MSTTAARSVREEASGRREPSRQPPAFALFLSKIRESIGDVVVAQHDTVDRVLVCLLARGHVLLEGVPGLAKTLLVETIAGVLGARASRIQFTPDLVPSDIVGTRIYRQREEEFDIELGPLFANVVLADEINRAPAKVQSALLEAMAERQVSIGGQTFRLPRPFLVLATQNPLESEGVYRLPDAQRDRFLFHVNVPYPGFEEEIEIVRRVGEGLPRARARADIDVLASLQRTADRVFVDRALVDYLVSIVGATRDPARYGCACLGPLIERGAGPRASLAIAAASRAWALLRGRGYVLADDVCTAAPDVLRHRVVLTYDAVAQGTTVDDVVSAILAEVPAPRVRPREQIDTQAELVRAQR